MLPCRVCRCVLTLALIGVGCQKSTPPAAVAPPKTGALPATGGAEVPLPASSPSVTDGAADAADAAIDLPEPEKSARGFVAQLLARKFDEATGGFDATMLAAMPAAKLEQTWLQSTAASGTFRKVLGSELKKQSQAGRDFEIVVVNCEFEKGAHDVRVVFDSDQKIAGLFISPIKPLVVGNEELWLGELNAGGLKLRLLVHLGKNADGQPVATFDSLDQGQKGIAFDKVTADDNRLRLEAKALQAAFDGEFSADRLELTGDWEQGGQKFPMQFKRVESAP